VFEQSDSPAVPGQTFQDRLQDGSLGPKMVVIPAGAFMMGSPEGEPKRDSDEGPQHRVRILKSFALGVTEVTFAEYDRFVLATGATGRKLPSDRGWGRGQRPVINVSWQDATEYAAWLAKQTGEAYRLPTESEWEYAARAGTTTPFSTGGCIHTDQANYDGNYDYAGCGAKTGVCRRKTVPAGSLPANPWGLHEMHGNVREWTVDCWHGSYQGAPNHGGAWGKENDAHLIEAILKGQADVVLDDAAEKRNVCCAGAAASVTAYAVAAGAAGVLLEQTTSWDVMPQGEPAHFVGYAGILFSS